MKKVDLVLAEIRNENYDIASIAEKTNTRRKRVIAIIDNQWLKGNIEGCMNEENTRFTTGSISELYMFETQSGKNRLTVAIVVLVIAIIEAILAAIGVFYTPFIAFGILTVLVGMIGLAIYSKTLRLGSPGYTRHRMSIVLVTIATIITFTHNIIMWILVAIYWSKMLT